MFRSNIFTHIAKDIPTLIKLIHAFPEYYDELTENKYWIPLLKHVALNGEEYDVMKSSRKGQIFEYLKQHYNDVLFSRNLNLNDMFDVIVYHKNRDLCFRHTTIGESNRATYTLISKHVTGFYCDGTILLYTFYTDESTDVVVSALSSVVNNDDIEFRGNVAFYKHILDIKFYSIISLKNRAIHYVGCDRLSFIIWCDEGLCIGRPKMIYQDNIAYQDNEKIEIIHVSMNITEIYEIYAGIKYDQNNGFTIIAKNSTQYVESDCRLYRVKVDGGYRFLSYIPLFNGDHSWEGKPLIHLLPTDYTNPLLEKYTSFCKL